MKAKYKIPLTHLDIQRTHQSDKDQEKPKPLYVAGRNNILAGFCVCF